MDLFRLADSLIQQQREKEHGFTVEGCLKIFGLSRSGYYAWQKRQSAQAEKEQEEEHELCRIMEKFRSIIRKLGFVPGKRTFRAHMFREYGITVSVKRCARIMRMMNLVANRPKKDAYKGQATHNHRCSAPENKVKQEFYIGPRKVVLTDITYLYYGRNRSVLYLCAFRDAYTREILGSAAGTRMTTELVREAYDRMMEKHGKELRQAAGCYIHSDQGSQYLSTSFQEILSDDRFIQSVSRRGNSRDNAPMESFFGQLKTRILDLVALCPNAGTAVKLIEGYIEAYNTKMYQYSLAGLTPAEYYIYVTQGIYPCDNYYGIKGTELLPVSALAAARLAEARKKEEKVRERNRRQREEAEKLASGPRLIISRDQVRLSREKSRWQKSRRIAEDQIAHIEKILEKTKEAMAFVTNASQALLDELRYPQNWGKYKELDYVFAMDQLF